MTEMWREYGKFDTKSKRLVEQTRLILKKGWLSNLEILKIYGQVNRQEHT